MYYYSMYVDEKWGGDIRTKLKWNRLSLLIPNAVWIIHITYQLSQIMNRTFSLLALQEPQNKINLHTYIAVSLCAVAVAVIAIMSAFIANYLYKRHRIKQQMNKAFQVLAVNSSIYTYSYSSVRQVSMPLISIRIRELL